MAKKPTSQRVAENLISTYGHSKFLYLIDQLANGTSGPVIAQEFGVTRQRVNQWKRKLGVEHIQYILAPEAEAVVIAATAEVARIAEEKSKEVPTI